MNKIRLCAGMLLCACLLPGCLNFQDLSYKSKAIDTNPAPDYPPEFHISGLTWIATEKAYCIPTCLQMIGEWNGIHEPVEYYNWLSGFSYGATYKDNFASFMPISDAMRGIMFASEFLGLERNLYGSNTPREYITAIKNVLSRGIPVMIMYDYNVLTEETFFFPHAAIITGYSEDTFFYYEPGFHEEYTPDAGKGKEAPIRLLMDGIMNLHRKFGLSDGYHYMIFSRTAMRTDFDAVWKRNAEMSRRMSISFINLHTGVKAFRALAKEIQQKQLPERVWSSIFPVWFSFGAYSREDNAGFIENRFASSPHCRELTSLLRDASAKYSEILRIATSPDNSAADRCMLVPTLLLELAEIEQDLAAMLRRMHS
ncbi:MAG: C39 family peptidase [Spirochaetales bacterium]|nr:C39 family peptidase [Spirochaetales bacterium]